MADVIIPLSERENKLVIDENQNVFLCLQEPTLWVFSHFRTDQGSRSQVSASDLVSMNKASKTEFSGKEKDPFVFV